MLKRVITLILLISVSISISSHPLQAEKVVKVSASQKRISQVIAKLKANFAKIKYAETHVTIDYNLHLFGCSGNRRLSGKAYYRYPYKIKAIIDGVTYFANKNRIRKIDKKGKRWYVRLINSINFKPGFHPGLIPYNFHLKLLKDDKNNILIEGLPKPGTLKNVTKIIFRIDPKESLLREMDLTLVNKRLSGKIFVDYKKIEGIWVPIGFHGKSAIEISKNFLVGLDMKFKGTRIKLNKKLPDKFFNPGF